MLISRIISGGQTGVDRAALDAAIAAGVSHGGWAPKGRWAEDGPIPERYALIETPNADPAQRTKWNVRDSDATLVIATAPLSGGTALTELCARRYGRPCFIVDPRSAPTESVVRAIEAWLSGLACETLNVGGPRASKDPAIYDLAFSLLSTLLARLRRTNGSSRPDE